VNLWTCNFTDFLWTYIGDLHGEFVDLQFYRLLMDLLMDLHGEFVDLLMDLHSRFVDLLVDLKISMNYIYRLAP
jgi:hypothetical protein